MFQKFFVLFFILTLFGPSELFAHSVTSTDPFCIPTSTESGIGNQESETVSKPEDVKPGPIVTSVIINEVFPNPKGSDGDKEFIEIKNTSAHSVDLKNWKLGDASKKRFTIDQTIPGHFIVSFSSKTTGISLNNSGTEITQLFDEFDRLVDKIEYSEKTPEDHSFSKDESGKFIWTSLTTPGFENKFVEENEEKEEKAESGNQGSENNAVTSTESIVDDVDEIIEDDGNIDFIELSEFLPNPEGSDEAEFIELFNPTENSIDLSGLKIDDEEGGSKPYVVPEGTTVNAGSYIVFSREDTGIALNNTGDAVRLLYSDGALIKQVSYTKGPEAESYAQDTHRDFHWTSSVTPGKINIITRTEEDTSKENETEETSVAVRISELGNYDIGDDVTVSGVVAVVAGILGSQYFYIADVETVSSTPGVQVYMYKREFPEMKIGDTAHVSGKIAESQGSLRIKTTNMDDIIVEDSQIDISAEKLEIIAVKDVDSGSFVEINGEVTELKTSHMYVDDGTDEIKIYFKKGAEINKDEYKVRDILEVKGIVVKTKTEMQLLPRSNTDVVKTGEIIVAPDVTSSTQHSTSSDAVEKYLTATAGGLTSIIVGVLAKTRGSLFARMFSLLKLSKLGSYFKSMKG
jgi:hypothetical protein